MKTSLITFCLLFLFHICCAPNITEEQQLCIVKRSLYEEYRLRYEKEYELFIDHLGYKESNNDWTQINAHDCFGEWQFSHTTLKHMGYGYITPESFRNNPSIFPREVQLEALKQLMTINEISLFSYEKYIGLTINGTIINKAGLLAGMHLGGLGGIKLFLLSNGKIDKTDSNGTRISDYIKEFSMYDLSRDYLNVNNLDTKSLLTLTKFK